MSLKDDGSQSNALANNGNQSSQPADDNKSNAASTLTSLLMSAPLSLPSVLPPNSTLAVGSAAAYAQSRAVQDAALASAAADDAKQVTNAINVIKVRHWNNFLTKACGIKCKRQPCCG
jgi:hypothetical protein